MSARENRRVVVFVLLAALLSILAAFWYHHPLGEQTTEERVREKAEQLRERVRDLTHGK